jgi:hypothetical protein
MKQARVLIVLVVLLGLAGPMGAQEGHPLKGTWYGDFGTGTDRHDLTVVMDWNGRWVSGEVHPGPNAIPLKSAVLEVTLGAPAEGGRGGRPAEPPEFRVRFEVDVPNAGGTVDSFVFEGLIYNPVAGNRRVAGTWTCGGEEGDFQIRRL